MALSAEDRFEIMDLIVLYSTAQTPGKSPADVWESLREIFTDDIVLDGPRGYYEGIEAVREFTLLVDAGGAEVEKPRTSNFYVVGDGDAAQASCKFIKIIERDPLKILTGAYEWDAVRTGGRWKMRRRICRIDGVPQWRDSPEYRSGRRYVRQGNSYVLQDAG